MHCLIVPFSESTGARSSGFQMKLLNVNATAQFLTPGYTGNEGLGYQKAIGPCCSQIHLAFTTLLIVIKRFPEQVLILALTGDHGDYENIFFSKIVLSL